MIVQTESLERVEDPAHRPVDLHDDVAVEAAFGFAFEFVAHVQRHVRHVVRHVQEKGAVLVALDEAQRVLGVPRGELRLVGHEAHDLLALDQRERRIILRVDGVVRPHVVRVGQAKIFVETMPRREELRRIAQMPLAENCRGVTACLEHLRDGGFLVADADL